MVFCQQSCPQTLQIHKQTICACCIPEKETHVYEVHTTYTSNYVPGKLAQTSIHQTKLMSVLQPIDFGVPS